MKLARVVMFQIDSAIFFYHRVGDADNFRLYQTPAFGYHWPFKLRKIPNLPKGLTKIVMKGLSEFFFLFDRFKK